MNDGEKRDRFPDSSRLSGLLTDQHDPAITCGQWVIETIHRLLNSAQEFSIVPNDNAAFDPGVLVDCVVFRPLWKYIGYPENVRSVFGKNGSDGMVGVRIDKNTPGIDHLC